MNGEDTKSRKKPESELSRIRGGKDYEHVNVRLPPRVMKLVEMFNLDLLGTRAGEGKVRDKSRSLKFQRFLVHLMAAETVPDFMEKYWAVLTHSPEMTYPVSRLLNIRDGACPTDDELETMALIAHFELDKLVACREKSFSEDEISEVNRSTGTYDFTVLGEAVTLIPKLLRGSPLRIRDRVLLENLKVKKADLDYYAANSNSAEGASGSDSEGVAAGIWNDERDDEGMGRG